MRAVILVPRRAGIPERDAAWAWCRARWEEILPELRIYEGADDFPDQPFSRAASLNDAARQADADGPWDLAVVVDADVFIDPANVRKALQVAATKGKVTWAFQRWNGLNPAGTELALGFSPDANLAIGPALIEKTNPISWSCCFVVPRSIWDELGGFDERFRGWGWEDMAFQSVVCGLYGHERIDGDIYHLWHPRAEERIRAGTPMHPAYVANRMLGRRYMYDLRRRGLHDRPTPSDEADMEQDRRNILRLAKVEELDSAGRPRHGMPDWRDWWPTLEELRDGARERRTPGPRQRLAIVVRTGGSIDRWPARSGYLRQALASLAEHVTYEPTVARIVFSDWPADVADELQAIAAEQGFYVVSGGVNRGFTPAMQALWRYLKTRTWPYELAFVTEDDFLLERDVPIEEMATTLAERPHLLQVALLRDAFYQAERDAGGILGHPTDAFEAVSRNGSSWLEHRRFFTLNPTLVRRSLFDRGWPAAQHSEAVFGRQAFADNARTASALWGDGEAWIRHIGEVRAGAGY